tara:strand:+ start:590 stop:1228 length:639 start_codon:yes stop_codon:yes gene_type:complete
MINILRKFRKNAATQNNQGAEIFLNQETDEICYLDRNRLERRFLTDNDPRKVGLELGTNGASAMEKLDFSYMLGEVEYDVYRFRSWVPLGDPPAEPTANFYAPWLATIFVSDGDMYTIKNSTNVESNNTGSGLNGYYNNPANVGAMVSGVGNVATPIDGLFGVLQDNQAIGLPQEYNGIFIIAADTDPFDCDVYVDIEFTVNKGATVELEIV